MWGYPRFGRAPEARIVERVPRFLVESYVVRSLDAFDEACTLARRTAESGKGIRYVDTTYLPDDETVLHLFDAPSVEELELAGGSAGLQFERIVQAVSDPSA